MILCCWSDHGAYELNDQEYTDSKHGLQASNIAASGDVCPRERIWGVRVLTVDLITTLMSLSTLVYSSGEWFNRRTRTSTSTGYRAVEVNVVKYCK